MSDDNKKTIIDKTTLVPIGLILTIATAIFFAGGLANRVDANEKDIQKIETKLEKIATKEDLDAAVTSLKEYINKP